MTRRVTKIREAQTSAGKKRESTQIVIVDDHELTRQSLRNMLSDEANIEVVGEAANGREALLLCSRFMPDLVLMDVRMPEMDGLMATREIKQKHPQISVMMLTMHENPDYLLEAIKAGAAGYVLKDASQEEIVEAVHQVHIGESPLDMKLAARLLKRLAADIGRGKDTPRAEVRRAPLTSTVVTPRQLEVLELMLRGKANRQIAQELSISTGTAKVHVEHIIAKLEVSDRTQAVVKALQLQLVELPEPL
jgi:DNA-binding NarL/FixJ family response regulator